MEKTILIVDDETAIGKMLGKFLSDIGYDTIICDNGKDAVLQIDNADLLITDCRMPGIINGVVLAKLAIQQKPEIPIIIMTATPKDVPADTANQVVEKPFNLMHLKGVIAELLQS